MSTYLQMHACEGTTLGSPLWMSSTFSVQYLLFGCLFDKLLTHPCQKTNLVC